MKRHLSCLGAPVLLLAGLVSGLAIGEAGRQSAGAIEPPAADKGVAAQSTTAPRSADRPARRKAKAPREPMRIGAVVGLRREKKDEYLQLHAHTWPAILEMIGKAHIRNYSIYMAELDDGNLYLFSSMEYVGDDYEKDMAELAKDPIMQAWWRLTDPCQFKLKAQPTEDRWMRMEEVFHTDGAKDK